MVLKIFIQKNIDFQRKLANNKRKKEKEDEHKMSISCKLSASLFAQ